MSLKSTYKNSEFGVGDRVKVSQKIKEGGKERISVFEGMIIAIKGRSENQTITVRRIGEAGVGIERIFQIASDFLEKIEVLKKGTRGVKHSKLYFMRNKSPKDVEEVYSKARQREKSKENASRKKK